MLGAGSDAQTGACTWDVYYADMAIVSTDGTVTPIYDGDATSSLLFYSSPQPASPVSIEWTTY